MRGLSEGEGDGESEGGARCWPTDLIMLYRPHLNDSCSCLMQECENLTKENAAITGHQNLRQKIQYHAATKLENTKLKEVGVFLSAQRLILISRPRPPFCHLQYGTTRRVGGAWERDWRDAKCSPSRCRR